MPTAPVAKLVGTVLRGTTPLAGATVRVVGSPFDRTVTTDAQGKYGLPVQVGGTYTLSVDAAPGHSAAGPVTFAATIDHARVSEADGPTLFVQPTGGAA